MKTLLVSKQQITFYIPKCIKDVLKGIEDRAYWYFTTDEAEFLSNVYVKEVQEEMLRKRLKQITDQAMDSVFSDIISGQLTKITLQPKQLTTTLKILQKVESITLEGPDYFSPEHPLARQNLQKIRMINEQQKQFRERIEMIKQKSRQRKLEKQAMEKEIQQKIVQEKKLQYHKKVMHQMQILKAKQEQRIEQNQKFKSFLKQFKKSKPLHVLMEEEFKQKYELPQLQENKKKLQLYKHKQKPTLQEINEHERTFMALKQNRLEKSYVKHHTIDVGYKSEFYKKIQEQERNGYEDEYSSIWDQMQKKKRYSLMVKENFKPKTSRVYQTLNASSVDNSHNQIKSERKIPPELSRVKQIGKSYLQYVKSLQKNRSNSAAVSQQLNSHQISKISQSRYTNYLEEFKKNTDSSSYRGFGTDWKTDLNDRTASKSEKRDRILIKSKQLQQKAMRDQMFIKNFTYGKAQEVIGKKKQIDETLLSAIKAKMALLKQVRQS